MKGLKYIAILLLVNILILIGHTLVPHQHHVASVTHPSSHECPATPHDHHDEDSANKQCHAFNDISFVKYNAAQLPLPEKFTSFMIVRDRAAVPEINPGVTSTTRFLLKLIVPSGELTGAHSLRGPPVLA